MLILIQATPTPWYQDPITVATWVIAVATVLYFVTTVGLLLLTKRIFEASHRPFIGTSAVTMTKTAGPPARALFQVVVQNFGAIPANNCKHEILIITDGIVLPTDVHEEESSTLVMPGTPLGATSIVYDPREYQALEKSRSLAVVFKCTYQGAQRKKYTTETKYEYNYQDNRFRMTKGKAD